MRGLRRLLAHSHLNAAVAEGNFGGQQGVQGTAQAVSRGLGNLPAAVDWVEFVSNYLSAFGWALARAASGSRTKRCSRP